MIVIRLGNWHLTFTIINGIAVGFEYSGDYDCLILDLSIFRIMLFFNPELMAGGGDEE